MYKYLLCWRYLKTRYIALASVISVMLGVATMIVVNSVMAGFSEKMRDRLHGVLADIIVEARDLDGFRNSEEVMARIKAVAGDEVEAMAPTMETFALMKWTFRGQPVTRQVQLIGIRPAERARTGDFAEFLFDQEGRKVPPSFEISESIKRNNPAGQMMREEEDPALREALKAMSDEQSSETGVIIGHAMANAHIRDQSGVGRDICLAPEGTRVGLIYPQAGKVPKAVPDDASLVVGYFKSGMSEYDSNHVYMPLEQMQRMRLLKGGRSTRSRSRSARGPTSTPWP